MDHRRWRRLKDTGTRWTIGAAGVGVVVALATIFVYLFSEVMPIFRDASVEPAEPYAVPGGEARTLHLVLDPYATIGTRFDDAGTVTFFEVDGGRVRERVRLPLPAGVAVTAFGAAEARTGIVAYGLSDGSALVARIAYDLTYPDDTRHVAPRLEFPLGEAPVAVADAGAALLRLAVQEGRGGIGLLAWTGAGQLQFARYTAAVSFLSGETQLSRMRVPLPDPPGAVAHLLLDTPLRTAYAAEADGTVSHYDLSVAGTPALRERLRLVSGAGTRLTALEFLLGTVSLVAGGSDGSLRQWMPVRDADNRHHLTPIRSFGSHRGAVRLVEAEYARKGFLSADDTGDWALHYATSHRTVLRGRVEYGSVARAEIGPRHDSLLLLDGIGTLHPAVLHNEHPDISWSSLWGKVWYEGRAAPEYVWQSSSATDEFERKFSLVPLSLGTVKAAFYAMLFAMPLAILGAVYSAYFMTPKLRGVVKPTIEVMEALPTVILGFLAGLWLAPFIENNLPAVFSVLLLTPPAILAFAWAWTHLPGAVRRRVPDGWEAALLVVPLLALGWACVAASPLLEAWWFDGDMRQWFTEVGIEYEQRNALVVGIAMGFAVIPTIFSIADDAVFSVPKHLTQGSLALGATRWQTVARVVLLTASPGIFSAVMIGLGRAIGETMIVLMATGNSPVVNFNVFEGMRTLSANIAVELPETAVGSTHFRILFLAALLLFAVTFVLNTAAEIVRQRLRTRYSQL